MVNHTNPITTVTTLHKQFMQLGRERNKLTYKLLSLLPQIVELEIYKKYNYSSIYEYAGKLAGLSHSVVEKTLAAHKNLRDKPHLKKVVESEGIHKVALVAKLATPKTDRAWADKVKNMSKHSLGELAREVRMSEKNKVDSAKSTELMKLGETGEAAKLMKLAGSDDGIPCNAAPTKINIELDEEMQFQFLKLKKKFGNQLSNKEVLRRILKEAVVKAKDSRTKTPNHHAVPISSQNKDRKNTSTKFPRGWNSKENTKSVKSKQKMTTRYIPAHQKRAALKKSDDKCAYPSCSRPPDVFHHTKRYSEARDHQSVTPLCKIHHEFAHSGLIENEEMTPHKWRLKVEAGVFAHADARFRDFRKISLDKIKNTC